MGLLGNIASLAAAAIIEEETTIPIKGFSAKRKNAFGRVKDEFFSKHPNYRHFYISDELESVDFPFINCANYWHYFVYNESDDLVYFFKSKKSDKRKAHMEIFDKDNKKIGDIREALVAARLPLFHEDDPVDYEIELVKGGCFTISSTFDAFVRLEDSKYGWQLKTKPFISENKLMDRDKEIAYLEYKMFRVLPLQFVSIHPDYPELVPIIYGVLDAMQVAK